MAESVLYGWNAVEEALRAEERDVGKVFVARERTGGRIDRMRALARDRGVPVVERSREQLDDLAGGGSHQGVVAVVAPAPILQLDDVLDRAEGPVLLVLLDGVQDPHNLGAVIRTAAAAGATAVVVPERRSAPLGSSAAKAASGGMERIALVREKNIARTVETLKERGVWVVGLDAEGEEDWDQVDLTVPTALVFGGEGKGLRRLVRERCDHLARMPLHGGMESLNVSAAAAAALYEAVRQRLRS